MRISGGLKTLYWILFSVVLHLLAWGSVSLTSRTFTPVSENIVDLTVLELPAGLPETHSTSTPRPAKVPRIRQNENVPDLNSSTSANDSSTSESGESTAVGGLGGDSETVSWSELTRLPKVHKEVQAQYPEEAKKARVDGPVHAELVIGRDGKVRHVHLLQGPGHGLNESALNALRQFEFHPAFKGNESVAVKIRYTYRFKLDIN